MAIDEMAPPMAAPPPQFAQAGQSGPAGPSGPVPTMAPAPALQKVSLVRTEFPESWIWAQMDTTG